MAIVSGFQSVPPNPNKTHSTPKVPKPEHERRLFHSSSQNTTTPGFRVYRVYRVGKVYRVYRVDKVYRVYRVYRV